jgi:hypothetical protein
MLSMETIPPPTISLPTSLLYHSDLPRGVILTWLQLRGLATQAAEDTYQTQPLNLTQVAALTNLSTNTLYSHLATLRSLGMLHWQAADKGCIIISFPAEDMAPADEPPAAQPEPAPTSPLSRNPGIPESPQPPSPLPPNQSGRRRREKRGVLQESRKPGNSTQNSSPGPPLTPPGSVPRSPVTLYRACMHLTLNAAQRQQVEETVSDPELWADSLDHWRTHGWNPRNLPGLLDFYSRGGPPMCRFCHPERQEDPRPSRPPRAPTPLESTLQAIAEIRAEQAEQNTCLPTPYPSSR